MLGIAKMLPLLLTINVPQIFTILRAWKVFEILQENILVKILLQFVIFNP